jgi:hypothetical protein
MTIRQGVIAALAMCAGSGCAHAVAPRSSTAAPNTEIFLASFHEGEKKTTRIALLVIQRQGVDVGKPVNITNHPADDSEPSFLPDSSGVVFSSSRGGPARTYRYDIATKAISEFRGTVEPPTAEGKEEGRTPVGSRIKAENSRLLILQEAEDHWIQIADLRKVKVGDITRIVVSQDGKWLAFVATPAVK